ncbi:S-adenosyl-L-methionine-dependent methyltransferase [Mycena sp. CBHHK59/15]|nr:S-adenosyl-L-methionine-dependent methyltransferase [Mycena sp. CBHHK59/15]
MLSLRAGHARQRTLALCYRSYKAPIVAPGPPPGGSSVPPLPLWRKFFPSTPKAFQNRVSVMNPNTAAMLADAFVPAGSRDKVIIEIFPGPGQLTRALLNLPRERLNKLIVVESADLYLNYLKPLEAVDSRLTVIPMSGESWDSYQRINDMRLLDDVRTIPWDQGVHPQLHFVSHLASNVPGEQFISQLFRSMPDKQWLFKYGRVPMSILLSEYIWKRVLGDDIGIRCKLSMIAAAVASCSEAVPHSALQPYADHFHPTPSAAVQAQRAKEKREAKRLTGGKPGNPFVAINIVPLESRVIRPGLLDKWDYCLRRLYVRRATPLHAALPYLAPNAQTLLKKISVPGLPTNAYVPPDRPIREMDVADWALLVKAFDEWPFAPEDLSIGDTIGNDEERHG